MVFGGRAAAARNNSMKNADRHLVSIRKPRRAKQKANQISLNDRNEIDMNKQARKEPLVMYTRTRATSCRFSVAFEAERRARVAASTADSCSVHRTDTSVSSRSVSRSKGESCGRCRRAPRSARDSLETSTSMTRPRTSFRRHCRTRRSSSARKTTLLIAAWRRIRTRLRRPAGSEGQLGFPCLAMLT